MPAKFSPPSIIALAFFILFAGKSLSGELRPSDHGLQYQLSSPPTPAGAKSPPEMLSFFGQSPSPPPSDSRLLPKAAKDDDDDSWWREGAGNRRDRVMRHVFLAASILCGVSAAALLVALTVIYYFRETASPTNEKKPKHRISTNLPEGGFLFLTSSLIFRDSFHICILILISKMAMKMKGIYKGFKCISQMFAVVKDREMEIGYPTDVKHVAHIGWEGSSGSAPGWMSEFKAGPELLSPRASSFGNTRNSSSFFSTCSSTDFDQASSPTTLETPRETGPVVLPNIQNAKRKNKKKIKSSSTYTTTGSLN